MTVTAPPTDAERAAYREKLRSLSFGGTSAASAQRGDPDREPRVHEIKGLEGDGATHRYEEFVRRDNGECGGYIDHKPDGTTEHHLNAPPIMGGGALKEPN